jgi:hypothetical protein
MTKYRVISNLKSNRIQVKIGSLSGNKSANTTTAKGDANKKPKSNSNKNEAKELQALAFGGPTKKKNNKKKSSATKVVQDPTQFEAWKQKDEEVRWPVSLLGFACK